MVAAWQEAMLCYTSTVTSTNTPFKPWDQRDSSETHYHMQLPVSWQFPFKTQTQTPNDKCMKANTQSMRHELSSLRLLCICVSMQSQHLANKCGELPQDDDKVCVKGCNSKKQHAFMKCKGIWCQLKKANFSTAAPANDRLANHS